LNFLISGVGPSIANASIAGPIFACIGPERACIAPERACIASECVRLAAIRICAASNYSKKYLNNYFSHLFSHNLNLIGRL
jgi:hypothetical protein